MASSIYAGLMEREYRRLARLPRRSWALAAWCFARGGDVAYRRCVIACVGGFLAVWAGFFAVLWVLGSVPSLGLSRVTLTMWAFAGLTAGFGVFALACLVVPALMHDALLKRSGEAADPQEVEKVARALVEDARLAAVVGTLLAGSSCQALTHHQVSELLEANARLEQWRKEERQQEQGRQVLSKAQASSGEVKKMLNTVRGQPYPGDRRKGG